MAVMGRAPRRRPSSESETHRHAPFPSSKRQRAANTPPGTNRKTRGGETTEIGLPEAVSAKDQDRRQTPRRPRTEGVSGSNPLVGSYSVTGDEVSTLRNDERQPRWSTRAPPGSLSGSRSRAGSGAGDIERSVGRIKYGRRLLK
jgi:hypothetical protein